MRSQDELINKSMSSIWDTIECSVEKQASLLAKAADVDSYIVFNFLMINLSMKMGKCGDELLTKAALGINKLKNKSSMH